MDCRDPDEMHGQDLESMQCTLLQQKKNKVVLYNFFSQFLVLLFQILNKSCLENFSQRKVKHKQKRTDLGSSL